MPEIREDMIDIWRPADICAYIMLQAQQVTFALQWKTIIALPGALLASSLHIEYIIVLLIFYLFSNSIDFFLGVLRAVKAKNFQCRLVGRWVIKLAVNLFLISLIMASQVMIYESIKIEIPILEYYIIILILTEYISIIDKIMAMNLPVPPLLVFLVRRLRRKVLKGLVKATGDENEEIKDQELAKLIDEEPADKENNDDKKPDQ
jgi:phage-related holin